MMLKYQTSLLSQFHYNNYNGLLTFTAIGYWLILIFIICTCTQSCRKTHYLHYFNSINHQKLTHNAKLLPDIDISPVPSFEASGDKTQRSLRLTRDFLLPNPRKHSFLNIWPHMTFHNILKTYMGHIYHLWLLTNWSWIISTSYSLHHALQRILPLADLLSRL